MKSHHPIPMISSIPRTDSDRLGRRCSPLRPQVDAEHRIFQRPKKINLENQNEFKKCLEPTWFGDAKVSNEIGTSRALAGLGIGSFTWNRCVACVCGMIQTVQPRCACGCYQDLEFQRGPGTRRKERLSGGPNCFDEASAVSCGLRMIHMICHGI